MRHNWGKFNRIVEIKSVPSVAETGHQQRNIVKSSANLNAFLELVLVEWDSTNLKAVKLKRYSLRWTFPALWRKNALSVIRKSKIMVAIAVVVESDQYFSVGNAISLSTLKLVSAQSASKFVKTARLIWEKVGRWAARIAIGNRHVRPVSEISKVISVTLATTPVRILDVINC
jgi:hypothetical protein